MGYKLVKHIIKVPLGHYCWEWSSDSRSAICEHFDNEYGVSNCELRFCPLKNMPEGVLKAPECDELENIADKEV